MKWMKYMKYMKWMKFITLQGLCKSFAYGGCEGKFIPRLSIKKNN